MCANARASSLRALSLYTGAGGLDLGVEAAGFEIAAAVESDAACCRTLRENRPWAVIERDVHEVPSDELLEVMGVTPGEIDLLVAGPPCQPFSKSAYWARGGSSSPLEDPRSGTLSALLRVVRDTRPRAFLLENVPGITYRRRAEGLALLCDTIDEINRDLGTSYSLHWEILNAADYGVPQVRNRAFIVGSREGVAFSFPAATHQPLDRAPPGEALREPWRTAWDAIGDLDTGELEPDLECTGKWARLLPSIPEGCNYLHHTPRGNGMPLFGWRAKYWNFLLKLAKARPSWTIQARPGAATGPFHWRSRRLSKRELCRLQTFPEDFQVLGTLYEAQRQLGNAVPSALAEAVAREIRAQLLDGLRIEGPLQLAPSRRGPAPGPEPVASVPPDFHHLAGDHPDHPGEGKGPAAQAAAG